MEEGEGGRFGGFAGLPGGSEPGEGEEFARRNVASDPERLTDLRRYPTNLSRSILQQRLDGSARFRRYSTARVAWKGYLLGKYLETGWTRISEAALSRRCRCLSVHQIPATSNPDDGVISHGAPDLAIRGTLAALLP